MSVMIYPEMPFVVSDFITSTSPMMREVSFDILFYVIILFIHDVIFAYDTL